MLFRSISEILEEKHRLDAQIICVQYNVQCAYQDKIHEPAGAGSRAFGSGVYPRRPAAISSRRAGQAAEPRRTKTNRRATVEEQRNRIKNKKKRRSSVQGLDACVACVQGLGAITI